MFKIQIRSLVGILIFVYFSNLPKVVYKNDNITDNHNFKFAQIIHVNLFIYFHYNIIGGGH